MFPPHKLTLERAASLTMASTRLPRAYDAASSSRQSKMIADSITIDDMNVEVSTIPTPAVKRTDAKEQQITFPHKLYEMLEYACDSEFNSACSWSADGSAFAISNRNVMMEELVPMFFRQTKFRSFVSCVCEHIMMFHRTVHDMTCS